MSFKLFDYQQNIFDRVVSILATSDRVCLAGTTGVGKTEIASQLMLTYPKARFLILTHGQGNLRTNFAERLEAKPQLKPDVFTLVGSQDAAEAFNHRIVVTLPQTAHTCLDDLGTFDFLIVDEAHQYYGEGKMYARILDGYKGKQVLLTASHYDLHGIPKVFFSREEALAVGRVEDVIIDLMESKTELNDQDFTATGEVKFEVEIPSATEIITEYLSSDRLPAIVAVHSIAAAKQLLQSLQSQDYFSGKVTISDSESDVDSSNMEAFKAGKYAVCIVVNRGQLGFDYPELISFIDASFSQNLNRIEQMVGRVARNHPEGKKDKFYLKLAPARQLPDVTIVMTAVIALGLKDVYSTWNGDPATLKLKLPKLLPEYVASISTSKAKGTDLRIDTQPTKKQSVNHLRLTFGDYLGMHGTEEFTLTNAQAYCKKLRSEKPWLAMSNHELLAAWVSENVNPATPQIWAIEHPESYSMATTRGWLVETKRSLGFTMPDRRHLKYETSGEFSAFLRREIKPTSIDDWKSKHPASYSYAKGKGWLKRVNELMGFNYRNVG